jgi:hypothetical protein
MNYPNIIIRKGSTNKSAVKEIQKALNKVGVGPLDVDGDFGPKTERAVKLFQTRFDDLLGNRLVVDGNVGPVTWSALFNQILVVETPVFNPFSSKVLSIAVSQIGVLESPRGSNKGPEVNAYLASTGLNGGHPWCMAFVYWCVQEASKQTQITNPLFRTAHVLTQWNKTIPTNRLLRESAMERLDLIVPGSIFIMDYGRGLGHTGFVEKIQGNILTTIEGNTNQGGSREGIGVFRRTNRAVREINKGFILL